MKQEKIVGVTNSVTGFTSVLGSWQICHNLCLGIITLLGIVGITLAGMPLLFLTKIAVPLWGIALGLYFVTIFLYFSKRCLSKEMILLNLGLIIAGIPFKEVDGARGFFWATGGILVGLSVALFIKRKLVRSKR